MNDGKYQPLTDNMDDLPRTLRRERDLRERAAREQQAKDAERAAWDRGQPVAGRAPATQPGGYGPPEPSPYDPVDAAVGDAGVVTRVKVPFFSLMGFFIKAVFAAIPALIILMAMLYWLGVALQTFYPQLIKMKIVISFPG